MDIVNKRIKSGKFVLIAEIGVNYYDVSAQRGIPLMDAAKLMVKEAANAGVHAVKFQSYKADTIALEQSPSYWDLREEPTNSQYELFKKYDAFSEKEYRELAEYSMEVGVEFMSTPFDINSVNYLESLMNVYKISSSDLNNLGFVKAIAQKNKPIIMSVGASDEDEIDRTIRCIQEYNDKPLTLMHCVLEYPTPYEHANLKKIISLSRRYSNCFIGYSDHTKPDTSYDVLKMAYLLGANVIEKHFTLDKTLKGNDHYHAMDPIDVHNILQSIERLCVLGGDGAIKCLESEKKARQNARRSLVADKDIAKGEVITEEKLTWKRPGNGIAADRISEIIGKRARKNLKKGEILDGESV
ncbi:MAG: N-acetylneuraminate synthase family protein [Eubacterium sp.]|nr:N-acetylneuraminate synthase family protein [Eubacterium sp.]